MPRKNLFEILRDVDPVSPRWRKCCLLHRRLSGITPTLATLRLRRLVESCGIFSNKHTRPPATRFYQIKISGRAGSPQIDCRSIPATPGLENPGRRGAVQNSRGNSTYSKMTGRNNHFGGSADLKLAARKNPMIRCNSDTRQ